MRVLLFGLLLLAGLLAAVPPVPAASLAQSVTASANIAAIARLSLAPATITFMDADPDLVPAMPSSTGPIALSARARTPPGARVTLSLLANDDLRSGLVTIPIEALTWTAQGSGFLGGTASRTAAQLVGSWTDSGVRSGTQAFALANSWTLPSGTFTGTLVYTLAAQ